MVHIHGGVRAARPRFVVVRVEERGRGDEGSKEDSCDGTVDPRQLPWRDAVQQAAFLDGSGLDRLTVDLGDESGRSEGAREDDEVVFLVLLLQEPRLGLLDRL